MIPIYKPYLKNYKKSALEAIDSEWISNHGKYLKLSSDKLCEFLNVKYCVLMNNGTSATHCLVKALKFKYPDIKKIYIPNNIFIAPINCTLLEYSENFIEIVEIDNKTLNMNEDEEYIMNLDKNSCIFIVHNAGNIINVPRINRLRPDIVIIEDNCEGFLGKYENFYTGTYINTLCSSISFYGNKNITTGEGGAFLTNDKEIYNYINKICNHGMSEKRYIHDVIGNNFRMNNVEAGLLYEQLNDIENIMKTKEKIFVNYKNLIEKKLQNYELIKCDKDIRQSNWIFIFKILNLNNFDDFEKFMELKNIQVRPFFYDLSEHKYLNIKIPNILDERFKYAMIPSYPELTHEQQEYIIDCISEYQEKLN
jgi:perosamine synthetase